MMKDTFFKYAPLYQFYIFCTYNRVHDVYHELFVLL